MRLFAFLPALGCVGMVLFFLTVQSVEAGAPSWRTYDGKTIEGKAIDFNFETKTVTLQPDDGERTALFSQDLDFQSKRRLLFSNVFHASYPDTGFFWSKEKYTFFAMVIFSPIILLIIGMWLSALFVARKFNPFSAVGAFLGSWIAGVILVICYMVMAAKSGSGNAVVYGGSVFAALVMALFVSAVYKTKFLKGLLIFVCHFLFAGLLGFLLIYGADILLPGDEVNAFWEKWVFEPTGLVGPPQTY